MALCKTAAQGIDRDDEKDSTRLLGPASSEPWAASRRTSSASVRAERLRFGGSFTSFAESTSPADPHFSISIANQRSLQYGAVDVWQK